MIDFASRRSLIVTMLTSGVLAAVVVFAAVLDSRAAPIYGPPGSESNVVVMDCSETEDDTFAVDDLSASGEVDVKVGDDCAAALNTLLSEGYQIVAGGGGAVFDSSVGNEHVVYTLARGLTINQLVRRRPSR